MPEYGQISYPRSDPDKRTLTFQLRRRTTPAEQRLWQSLRADRLAGLHFRRQQLIAGFIVDFYCHAARLAVEVDGPVHETQAEYDAERDRILGREGIQVLHIANEDVERRLPLVLRHIIAACGEASPTPASPEGSAVPSPPGRSSLENNR